MTETEKVKKQAVIGRMYRLWKDGKTAKEIAEEVHEPLDKVAACVDAFPEYERLKASKKKRSQKKQNAL